MCLCVCEATRVLVCMCAIGVSTCKLACMYTVLLLLYESFNIQMYETTMFECMIVCVCVCGCVCDCVSFFGVSTAINIVVVAVAGCLNR